MLNVPVPFGAIYTALHHLVSRTPALSWLKPQVSAQDMMDPELYEKLVLNNFCKSRVMSTHTDILQSEVLILPCVNLT